MPGELRFGNAAPKAAVVDPETGSVLSHRKVPGGPRVTYIGTIPEEGPFWNFQTITEPQRGVWQAHSYESPAWIDGDLKDDDEKMLVQMLAHFYDCPIGTPKDVEDTHHTLGGAPGVNRLTGMGLEQVEGPVDTVAEAKELEAEQQGRKGAKK